MYANTDAVVRNSPTPRAVTPEDHSKIYNDETFNNYTDIGNPYATGANPL